MSGTASVAVKNLRIALPQGSERPYAVDGVSFDLNPGEIVYVVGESGSGKSMCAHALMGLLPDTVTTESGEITLEGRNLIACNEEDRHDIRGRRIAMVFQEPMTALNPLMRIGDQMMEMFEAHGLLTPRERRDGALGLAREVGLPDPERIVRAYPHQLSGWPWLFVGKLKGMSEQEVAACASDQAQLDKMSADQQYAVRELKVGSTPTFFLNGVKLQGSMPFEDLEERIKPLLRK